MAGRGSRERKHSPQPSTWRRFKDALSSNQNFEYLYWCQVIVGFFFDWTMRLVGPLLLLFASVLISGVIGMYFLYILPATATFGSIAVVQTFFELGYLENGDIMRSIVPFNRQADLRKKKMFPTFHYSMSMYCLHACWALFLAFNVFFNYFHCAFTHAGTPEAFLPSSGISDSEDDDTEDDEETGTRPLIGEVPGISRVNVGTADGNGVEGPNRSGHRGSMVLAGGGRGGSGGGLRVQVGYCKKCREPKPARAHHCHVCDECIVNMDHHCPWMNNCVGYLNYRYFVLFLIYMFVGCCYAVSITGPQFLALARTNHRHGKPHPKETKLESAIMMTFVLSLSVGIAIFILLGWHIYLILTAQTTIEFYQNQTNRSRARQWGELWSNPFDVGCKGNWQQVFGPKPFIVSLLPSRRTPPPPIVDFFPLEDRDSRRGSDEGEWTVGTSDGERHMV